MEERMEESVKWEGTIFDGTKLEEGLEMEDKKPIYYFVSIVMYCISFFYLFSKSLPSTYIVYVFLFILNTVFPFIWIQDFFGIVPVNINGLRLVLYRTYGVGISLCIQFFSLFLLVLSNENIRKMKVFSMTNDQRTNNREKVSDMSTNDAETRLAYRHIAILFVTITTLMWGVVGEAFSDNKIIKLAVDDNTSALVKTIRWLLNQPYQVIYNFDTLWNNFMQTIKVSPLVKAAGMFCSTFLVMFFGLFVRIKHFKHPLQHNINDRFNIVNLGPMFPPFFKRNVEHYRNLSVFFLSLIISVCFGGIMLSLKSFFPVIPKLAVVMSTLMGFAIFFGCFFGKRKQMFPDLFSVKKLIYFLLCIIFTIVGTPVILGGIQLLLESGLLDGIFKFCLNVWSGLTSNGGKNESSYPMLETLNTNGLLGGSALVLSIVLFSTMYGLGVDKKWVTNSNGKSMQMFLVTLITMSVAMFAALNTKYKVCTALYSFLRTLIELILVYLAPVTMVALSIVLFVFSYKNYTKYKQYEKLKK